MRLIALPTPEDFKVYREARTEVNIRLNATSDDHGRDIKRVTREVAEDLGISESVERVGEFYDFLRMVPFSCVTEQKGIVYIGLKEESE